MLQSSDQLEELQKASQENPVVIFKHSTRCSVSAMALSRLERAWNPEETEGLKTYLLDLISFRSISNQIVQLFGVQHESPQVLVIDKGECVYHTSHMGINYEDLKSFANSSHS